LLKKKNPRLEMGLAMTGFWRKMGCFMMCMDRADQGEDSDVGFIGIGRVLRLECVVEVGGPEGGAL